MKSLRSQERTSLGSHGEVLSYCPFSTLYSVSQYSVSTLQSEGFWLFWLFWLELVVTGLSWTMVVLTGLVEPVCLASHLVCMLMAELAMEVKV